MTDRERKRIFGLSRQLGMNSEELHTLVYGVTGTDSLRELDRRQTYDVTAELNNRIRLRGFEPKRTAKKAEEVVPGMMTSNQKNYCWSMIYRLAELEPRNVAVGERMCGAVKKILDITAMPDNPFKWITAEQGRSLIEGLKRYVESAERKAIREGRLK